jgi:hypothetical protein
VEVDDWETGGKLVLQLEPDKGPVEQAEALYKKVCGGAGCVLLWASDKGGMRRGSGACRVGE